MGETVHDSVYDIGIIIIYGADYADCCDGVSGGVGDKFMGLQIS